MPDTEPVRQSLVSWILAALGFPYVIVLPLAGLLSFLLVLVVVLRGRGAMGVAAIILIVNIPLLVGVFAGVQGAMASYMVIATSTAAPKPSEMAAGISTALAAPLVGMLLMIPGYATAAFGTFIRAICANAEDTNPGS